METGIYRSAAPWIAWGVSLPWCHVNRENFKQFVVFYIALIILAKEWGFSIGCGSLRDAHSAPTCSCLVRRCFSAAESNRIGSWGLLNVCPIAYIRRYYRKNATLIAKTRVRASTGLQIREERCSAAEAAKVKSRLFWCLPGWRKMADTVLQFPSCSGFPGFKRNRVIVYVFAREHRFHLRRAKEQEMRLSGRHLPRHTPPERLRIRGDSQHPAHTPKHLFSEPPSRGSSEGETCC